MTRQNLMLIGSALMAIAATGAVPALGGVTPLGSVFTYQGQLKQADQPVTGEIDVRFRVFDAASQGAQVGPTIIETAIELNEGQFTAELDFGNGVFTGDERWLQVAVRVPHDPTNALPFTVLSPRQLITASPYALFALNGNEGPQGDVGPPGRPGPPGPPGAAPFALNGNNAVFTQGNVGIGTPTPTQKLHVDGGNIRLTAEGFDPFIELNSNGLLDATAMRIKSLDTLGLAVTDGSNNVRMLVRDTGNVGIGTNTPGAGLHVVSAAGLTARFDGVDNNGVNAGLRVSSGSQIMLMDGNELDSLDAGGLFLNNNVQHDVILANGGGHVGIGNTAPPASLSIGNPSVFNVFTPGGSSCFAAQATPGCDDQGCEDLVCAIDAFCCDNAWDSICVGEANDLCIGRVGIGTSAPVVRLHVAGGSDASVVGGGFIVNGSVTGANLVIDNNEIMARINGDTATLMLNADGGNVNILQNGGGNVGIGDSTPSARLDVAESSNTVAIFNRNGNDGVVVAIRQGGAQEGTISVAGATVSYNAFTGSHYGWTPGQETLERFALVRMTGENRRLRGDPDAEVIYGIEPTNRANDPACLGAYLAPRIPINPPTMGTRISSWPWATAKCWWSMAAPATSVPATC